MDEKPFLLLFIHSGTLGQEKCPFYSSGSSWCFPGSIHPRMDFKASVYGK